MPTTRVIAQSPFDNTAASIVLRSCDNVEFYVYKEILKVASPFFSTMFSLPQPPPPTNHSINPSSAMVDEMSPEGLIIIPMPEDSESLDYILRVCYPLRTPARLTSLSLVEKVLASALKYEIDRVVDRAKKYLVRLGRSDPVCLYMISCKFGMEEEARIAASLLRERYCPIHPRGPRSPSSSSPPLPLTSTEKDFVRIAIEVYNDKYSDLPAIFLYRLLKYIQSGEQQSFSHPSLLSPHHPRDQYPGCESLVNESDSTLELSSDLVDLLSKHPTDILLQSSDGMVVPTHKLILRIASGDTILSQSEVGDCPQRNNLSLVSVPVTGKALIQLVRACCFPLGCHEDGHKPEDDLHLFYSAQSCGMHKIATTAKERWLSHLNEDPLNSYFIASLNGWVHEACEVLRYMATEGIPASSMCVTAMCIPGTAKHYHALLQYYDAIQRLEKTEEHHINFPSQGVETWNHPSYASSANITPMVAFRALQVVLSQGCNYGYGILPKIVDPPRHQKGSLINVNVDKYIDDPARFIRAMVHDSRRLDKKRKRCLEMIDASQIVEAATM
ncbi:hypothetical protein QCA50_015204 [Cerrena zonata]|uniref:BTB domain-containing protein n=1 Tax=Cerrena zonata TaxID=2478898 RepID=A0AAW0FRG1_9APHY